MLHTAGGKPTIHLSLLGRCEKKGSEEGVMKRHEFTILLGCTASAAIRPCAALAQEKKPPAVGFLGANTPTGEGP
jgi:hypothetical protein